MNVLYDTSVLLDDSNLGEWEEHVPVVSAVSLAELEAGRDNGDALERSIRRNRANFISSSLQILPFGREEAEAYGVLVALVRDTGRSHRGRILDLQIAATAMTRRLPLLTRNARDLVGLERAVQVVPITG